MYECQVSNFTLVVSLFSTIAVYVLLFSRWCRLPSFFRLFIFCFTLVWNREEATEINLFLHDFFQLLFIKAIETIKIFCGASLFSFVRSIFMCECVLCIWIKAKELDESELLSVFLCYLLLFTLYPFLSEIICSYFRVVLRVCVCHVKMCLKHSVKF